MLKIAIRERSAINRMCAECKALEPLALAETEWMFLGNVFQVMLPLYEKLCHIANGLNSFLSVSHVFVPNQSNQHVSSVQLPRIARTFPEAARHL
jgi:hypothetical protein